MTEPNPEPRSRRATAHGHRPEEVFEALLERRSRARDGLPFDDGRKVGLVLEGGGMRAAGPAGGIVRLAQLGFGQVFDEVYATSAGVMNAAYFLSDQVEMGITIYHEDLASRSFVNPWRFWKIMDLDWVFRRVIRGTKPLDTEALHASRSDFFVAATEFETGNRRLIDLKRSGSPPLDVLKAAMAIPLLYNRTVPIEGTHCFDGGLLNPFPINDAIERGCSHILVLLSRDASYERERSHPGLSGLFDWLFARGSSELQGMLARYPEIDRLTRELALGRSTSGAGARIATICPPRDCPLGRSTIDRHKLTLASQRFGDQMDALLAPMSTPEGSNQRPPGPHA